MAIRIDQVQNALGEIVQWSCAADTALSSWLRAHRELGMRDRSELAEGGPGPASRRLAILTLDATLARDVLLPKLKEDESEWLYRTRSVRDDTLPAAVRASLPDWLYGKMIDLDDTADLVAALNRPAALDIRVNPMSAVREKVLVSLQHGPAAKLSPTATLRCIRRGGSACKAARRSTVGRNLSAARSKSRTRAVSCWFC